MTEGCGCNEAGTVTCYYHKLRTIQFGGAKRSPQTQMESRWDKDMPAYIRLRHNGLQPKQIDGCAELESRANDQMEIEMGDLLTPLAAQTGKTVRQLIPGVNEAIAATRDLAWTPQDSVEAMKDNKGNEAPVRDS